MYLDYLVTNLANIIYERQLIKALLLYYPELKPATSIPVIKTLFSKMPLTKIEKAKVESQRHLEAIMKEEDINIKSSFQRWGKFKLPNGRVLNSSQIEARKDTVTRSHYWFEAKVAEEIIFGQAIAFYEVSFEGRIWKCVVYNRLIDTVKRFDTLKGIWSTQLSVLSIEFINDLVGIWKLESSPFVYILRKYPALDWLTSEERESVETEENESLE